MFGIHAHDQSSIFWLHGQLHIPYGAGRVMALQVDPTTNLGERELTLPCMFVEPAVTNRYTEQLNHRATYTYFAYPRYKSPMTITSQPNSTPNFNNSGHFLGKRGSTAYRPVTIGF